MNNAEKGIAFEREALEILKKEFDDVKWLSENKRSKYDFLCSKDGKDFTVEAKMSNTQNKPQLRYSQKEVDYLIFKDRNGVIRLIEKSEFKNKVMIQKDYCGIPVSEETGFEFEQLQLDLKIKGILKTKNELLKLLMNSYKESRKAIK